MLMRIVRAFMAMVIGFAAFGLHAASAQTAPAKKVEVRIGWMDFAGATSAIAAYMMNERLLERHAAAAGYELKVTWRAFRSGPSLNEAMVAREIDLQFLGGALPTVSLFAADPTIIPIAMTGSHISNAVLVAPQSPIKDIADLKGKTVGLVVGSSSHYMLASIVHVHFGQSLEQLGIRIVNMPPADAMKMPRGIDAAGVFVPHRFIGPHMGLSELLVDADGYTGKGHKHPGSRLPEVRKSWAFPEGYNSDRLFAFAREQFLAAHPDVVVAFHLAFNDAQSWVVGNQEKAVALINTYWKLPGTIAATALQTYAEGTGVRRTPVILESDVLSVIKASEFLASIGGIARPMTWESLKPIFAKGAQVQKIAWQKQPQVTVEQMKAGFRGEAPLYGPIVVGGGAPVWEWATTTEWGKRTYVPGPFTKR